jgi:dTDP-4-amino-4,6-dideoxygalactose transaminase
MTDAPSFTDIYVDEETVDAVADVLRSGRYVKGPVVERFERRFASACGVDHAVAVGSGTDAILLALKGAGVGEGDEVIVPGHTFFATVSPVLHLGATPRFVDIDPETYTMDPAALAAAAEESAPTAVVPVHIYGGMAEMSRITDLADEYDLTVVEDACQAHFATREGATAGTVGDAGAFSFYPTKNMTVAGDGGMLVTDDERIARRARRLRNHGRGEEGSHRSLGLNHRMSEVHAAVGVRQLDHVRDWGRARATAARRYTERLDAVEEVVTPTPPPDGDHVYHLYVIQVPAEARDDLRAALDDAGIDTGIHYPTPAHEHPPVVERVGEVSLPRTERLCDRIVSLPIHPRISREEVDRVCDAVEAFFGGAR